MYHSFLSHSSADEHLGCFHVLGIINSAPSVLLNISIISNESALHITLPKYWSFSISPSSEYSGLIFFRIDWFDLLAVQGTLQESFPAPQFKSINCLALSLLYGPTLTSICDNWKSNCFDYTYRLLLARWCLWFLISCLGLSLLSFQGAKVSFNSVAAVTIYSDFGGQEN